MPINLSLLILELSIIIIRAPSLVSNENHQNIIRVLGLLIFWSIIIGNKTTLRLNYKNLLLLTTVFIIIITGIVNGKINDAYNYKIFFWYLSYTITIGALFIVTFLNKELSSRAPTSLLKAIFYYIILIVFLLILGVENPVMSEASKLSYYSELAMLLGVRLERIPIPMASGFNQIGVVATLAFLISVIAIIHKHNHRKKTVILASLCLLSSLTIILISSPKGSVALLLVLLPLAKVYNKISPKLIFLALFSYPIIFYSILLGEGYIIKMFSLIGLDKYISLAYVGTLSHRTEFWGVVIEHLSTFSFSHLIGSGLFGHFSTGLSNTYIDFISGERSIKYLTTHNSFLQSILDYGYIGMISLYAIYFNALLKALKLSKKHHIFKYYFFILIFFYLLGMTEVVPSLYHQESFFITTWIIIATLLFKETKPEYDNNRRII